jgi:hypothetical protein
MVEGGAGSYSPDNPFMKAHQNSGDKLKAELLRDDLPYDVVRMIEVAANQSVRLDGLDRLLAGDTDLWLQISEVRGGTLEVRVDNVMGEHRQLSSVFRQMLTEINRRIRDLDNGGAGPEDDPTAGL